MRHIFGSSGSVSRDHTYTCLVWLTAYVSVIYRIHMGNNMSLNISVPYIGTYIIYLCLIILWCFAQFLLSVSHIRTSIFIISEVTTLIILSFLNTLLVQWVETFWPHYNISELNEFTALKGFCKVVCDH